MDNYIILGVDASLTNTGICILKQDGYDLRSIKGGKYRGPERLHRFKVEFQKILDEIHPTLATIEDYAYAVGRGGRVYSIGELGGLVRLLFWENNIKYYEVSPPSVKKFLTGSGACEKSLILKEVYRRWNVDVTDDNLADAVVIAKIGEALANSEIHLTKSEMAVIQKIKETAGETERD